MAAQAKTRPAKLIVAYRTVLVPGVTVDESSIKAPSNYKDPAKIAEYIESEKAKATAELVSQPYTATFDEVVISDPAHERNGRWKREAQEANGPVCMRIRAWLLKEYADAWPHSTHVKYGEGPQAIFVGFNPRLFIKMLGLECSLPRHQPKGEQGDPTNVMPLSMWYTNSDHRDIEEAVKPKEYKFLTWQHVLKERGLDGEFKDWPGPGVDPMNDMILAYKLAFQLGMFSEQCDG